MPAAAPSFRVVKSLILITVCPKHAARAKQYLSSATLSPRGMLHLTDDPSRAKPFTQASADAWAKALNEGAWSSLYAFKAGPWSMIEEVPATLLGRVRSLVSRYVAPVTR